jgi:ABC-type Zn uptake system ZnuABC Zn-binding protein ZnuA
MVLQRSCFRVVPLLLLAALVIGACQGGNAELSGNQPQTGPAQAGGSLNVLVVESFLADIAQNVAGDRIKVGSLLPLGMDPHAFEATPQDVARIADANVLITNGAGLEEWLQEVLTNAGGKRTVIEAAAGLVSRPLAVGDVHASGDPHFWLDPINVITYTQNIRDGLIAVDPAGKEVYTANAAAYIAKLEMLDKAIAAQIQQIPAARRLLVTNHESLGYYADRYGLTVAGTVIPSLSSNASPSAQELARLADTIRRTGAPAVFLEAGVNPQLAQQMAAETGVKVVTNLYTETITEPGGVAPTYLDMMRYNTQQIVDALK